MRSSELGCIHDLRRNSFTVENSLEEARRKNLISRRVRSVDAEIVAEYGLTFPGERVPVNRLFAGLGKSERRNERRQKRGDAEVAKCHLCGDGEWKR